MWRKLKSLFVVEVEEEGKERKEPFAPAAPAGPVVRESTAGEAGKVTRKFTEILFKAIEDNNLEGFDYLEYKKALQSLKKVEMEDATRYQSAFAMARTMGASLDHLVQSAQHYLKVLQQEEEKFARAAAKQRTTQVEAREQEITKLAETVRAKEEQIRRLQQEIGELNRQMETMRQEIKTSAGKVETTKNDFIASYNNLVSQIQQDIDKMKQYLG